MDVLHDLLQSAYATCLDVCGERLLYTLVLCLCNTIPFMTLNLFGQFVLRESETNWAARYRILPGKKSDVELTRRARNEALVDHFFTSPLFLYFVLWHLDQWINPDIVSAELPSLATVVWQLAACMAIEDTLMYWAHRFEHHPAVYAGVHKLHHEFHVSNGWAASFSTLKEKIFGFTLPAVAGVWLLRSHIVTRGLYIAILVVDSFVAHCGYDFPWVPFSSALRHNYHHSHNVGTYGLKFPFWDWAMGTDKAFNRWKAKYEVERKARWEALDAAAAESELQPSS